MKKRILIVITILVLIAACILGIVKRQTYTDITREINYMNKLQVAEIPGDLAVEVCEDMKNNLPKLPIILKVRFINDVEFLFGTSRQRNRCRNRNERCNQGCEYCFYLSFNSHLAPPVNFEFG